MRCLGGSKQTCELVETRVKREEFLRGDARSNSDSLLGNFVEVKFVG